MRVKGQFGLGFDFGLFMVEADKNLKLLMDDASRLRQSLLRRNRAIGFYVYIEFLKIRIVAHACVCHLESRPSHRVKNRVPPE